MSLVAGQMERLARWTIVDGLLQARTIVRTDGLGCVEPGLQGGASRRQNWLVYLARILRDCQRG